jgi:hypothetical protein
VSSPWRAVYRGAPPARRRLRASPISTRLPICNSGSDRARPERRQLDAEQEMEAQPRRARKAPDAGSRFEKRRSLTSLAPRKSQLLSFCASSCSARSTASWAHSRASAWPYRLRESEFDAAHGAYTLASASALRIKARQAGVCYREYWVALETPLREERPGSIGGFLFKSPVTPLNAEWEQQKAGKVRFRADPKYFRHRL